MYTSKSRRPNTVMAGVGTENASVRIVVVLDGQVLASASRRAAAAAKISIQIAGGLGPSPLHFPIVCRRAQRGVQGGVVVAHADDDRHRHGVAQDQRLLSRVEPGQ